MSIRLIGTLTLAVWLFMATTSVAQSSNNPYVLDTKGEHLESDEEYFIRPAITDNGGRFTLIDRNGCPLNVGLENTDTPQGYPVKFTPLANNGDDDDDEVRVNRDLKVTFQASSTCVQSTEWKLGENDTRSGRRLIVTGRDNGIGSAGNYFRIVGTQNARVYNIEWCPTEACPTCRFICGTAGTLHEDGKILLALDASALPVEFHKKDD
ncbi:hypothetical protein RJT34_02404 [Clitoria ternatea]|uniref:Uncharacterized protein n=1 Tax=Clitoria ternatea TaxID=43366 RepID=A0AAN9KJ23_CLITE